MFQRRFGPALAPGPLAEDHAGTERHRPRAGSKALARLRGASLDGALARGADPARSPVLAARAAHLTAPRARFRLADCLEQLIVRAREAPRPGRITPQRRTVLAEQDRLQELAHVLNGPEPVYAQGMAMLRLLLTDGAGPVFARAGERSLTERVDAVHSALRGS